MGTSHTAPPRRASSAGHRRLGRLRRGRHRRLTAALALTALLGAAPAGAGPPADSPAPGPAVAVAAAPDPPTAGGTPVPTPIPAGLHWRSPAPDARPGDLLRGFDAPARPWDAGHRGVDLRLRGDVVLAPADGTVRHVGMVAGRPVLSIDHGQQVVSSMEPVVAVVAKGERVRAGQPIGRPAPGAEHCGQPCVHLGVRVLGGWLVGGTLRDRYLDPALLLGLSGPSVLWPSEGRPRSAATDSTAVRSRSAESSQR